MIRATHVPFRKIRNTDTKKKTKKKCLPIHPMTA